MAAANAPAAQLGPQPDFNVMGDCLDGFRAEFGKIRNLPSIAEGNSILLLLQQMQQQMQEMRQEMQEMRQQMQEMQHGIVDIRTSVQNLQTKQQTLDYNSIARLENSKANQDNFELTPFYSLTTNGPIQGFPKTPLILAGLQGAQLNHVLTALNLPTGGGAAERRKRLAQHIGVPTWRMG